MERFVTIFESHEDDLPMAPLYEEQDYLMEGVNDPGIFKAVFLGGGPGSGKDFVMNKLLKGYGLVEINSDVAFEALMKKHNLDPKMPTSETEPRDKVRGIAKNATMEKQRLALGGRLGLVINGTGDDPEKYAAMKKQLEHLGYDTAMVFINTSDSVSKERNIERGKNGGREVPEEIRKEKWDAAQQGIEAYKKVFGHQFANVDNSTDARFADKSTRDEITKNFLDMYKMMRSFTAKKIDNPEAIKWLSHESSKRNIHRIEQIHSNKFSAGPKNVPVKNSDNKHVEDIMQQAKLLGLTYYGFGRFGKKVNGKETVTHIIGDNHKLQLKQATRPKPLKKVRSK